MTDNLALFFLLLIFLALFAFHCMAGHLTPAFGWDYLDFWGIHLDSIGDLSLADRKAHNDHEKRHGLLFPILLSYLNDASLVSEINLAAIFYLFCHLLAAVLVAMFCFVRTSNSLLSLILGYLFLATPLLENHAIVIGYTEPVLRVLLLIIVTASGLYCEFGGNQRSGRALCVLLLAIATTAMVTVRNTGFLYVVAISVSVLLALLAKYQIRFIRKHLRAFLITFSGLIWAVYLLTGLFIESLTTEGVVMLAGRYLSPSYANIHDSISVFYFSLVTNSSFGMTLVTWTTIFFILLWADDPKKQDELSYIGQFAAVGSVVLLVSYFLAQNFSYVHLISKGGSDTGFSRFLGVFLPSFVALCVPEAFLAASKKT